MILVMWTPVRRSESRTLQRARILLRPRSDPAAVDRARLAGADPRFHRLPETRSCSAARTRRYSPCRGLSHARFHRGTVQSRFAVDPVLPAIRAADAIPASD